MIARLQQHSQLKRLQSSLTAGLVAWVTTVIIQISFAVLIFSGDLSDYIANGLGITLFGATVVGALVALISSFPGAVALPQGSPAAILAFVAAAIAGRMTFASTSDETFFTVVAAIAVTSLLTGLLFLALGWFRLGGLIRFIPYPVVGGFLAGSGWLLFKGAIAVMAGVPLGSVQAVDILQPVMLGRWLPGIIFAIVLLITLRRFNNFLIMPGMMLGAIAVFYLVVWLFNISMAEIAAQGWLLGPFPEGGLWQPLTPANLALVDWSAIVDQTGNIATVLIVSVVSLLLIASELELAIKQDVDLDRELQATGVANLASGLGSGILGFHGLSLSTLGYKMGLPSRLIGLFSALLCGVTLFFGGSVLALFPKPVLGGLLMYLGLVLLVEWVYEAWFKLPKADYFVVILILVTAAVFGFLQGVGTGILVAVIMFVFNYSRIQAVKHALTGSEYQSNFEHSIYHQELLQRKKNEIFILFLQGYIFFGTANTLLERIRQRVADPTLPAVRFLILDFALVNGLDSSALLSFRKMKWLAQAHRLTLVFTDLSAKMQRQLEQAGCIVESDPLNKAFSDLDHGLEWCENQLLVDLNPTKVKARSLAEELATLAPNDHDATHIMNYLEPLQTPAGYYVFKQGASSDGIYFVEFGQVTVYLERPDGQATRLRTMGSGTIIGEMGLYTGAPRSASVVTDWPSRLYRLSNEALAKMENEEPHLAVIFHQFMGRLLASRLVHANKTVDVLLEHRETEHTGGVDLRDAELQEAITRIRLTVESTGEEILVKNRPPLVIGRAETQRDTALIDIDLNPYHGRLAGVSRQHCRLLRTEEQWYVEDLGSPNGTFVNDHKVARNRVEAIRTGDVIVCGQLRLRFEGEVRAG